MIDRPLKLLAQDSEDVSVLAAVLQDAIVPVSDISYRAAENSFVMVMQRFCWDEVEADGEGEAQTVFERICCALDIDGVRTVQFTGIDPEEMGTMLDLLTIALEGNALLMIFAGGGKIRIILEKGHLRLRDFGESWPTTHRPRHVT